MITRPATPGDQPAIAEITLATGQPPGDGGDDPGYFELLMETGAVRVCEDAEGRILGWGATRAGFRGSLLCDLFVDPRRQGGGVGRALLASLWPAGDGGARYTFSSLHPGALPLYVSAGLAPVWPLLYLSGRSERMSFTPSTLTARAVAPELAARVELELGGIERVTDYQFWIRTEGSQAVAIYAGEQPVAVGAVRPGALVHLVCEEPRVAGEALASALSACGPDPVELCLPGPHPALATLLGAGFRVSEHDLAMATPGLLLPPTWVYHPGLS